MPESVLRPARYVTGLASCLGFLASCELTGSTLCTASIEPAVVVRIIDSVTGAPRADGASGVVRDGSYWDHLVPSRWEGADTAVLVARQAAPERPGTYRVEVTHPGYAPGVLTGIRVEAGTCHVLTREVTLQLSPVQ